MSSFKIISRYAKSLIEIGVDQNQLKSTVDDAEFFSQVCKSKDFINLLKNPIVKPDVKLKIFDKLFKNNVNNVFYQFLVLVIKKGRESLLPEIADEIQKIYKKMLEITDIQLTTASKLSDDFVQKLNDELLKSSITQKELDVKTIIDPKIIGGFVLKIQDKLIDASVLSKLKQVESEIIAKGYEKLI